MAFYLPAEAIVFTWVIIPIVLVIQVWAHSGWQKTTVFVPIDGDTVHA
jgi:hypothetical protein